MNCGHGWIFDFPGEGAMPTVKIGALLTQWIAALIGGAIIFFSFKDRWSGR